MTGKNKTCDEVQNMQFPSYLTKKEGNVLLAVSQTSHILFLINAQITVSAQNSFGVTGNFDYYWFRKCWNSLKNAKSHCKNAVAISTKQIHVY